MKTIASNISYIWCTEGLGYYVGQQGMHLFVLSTQIQMFVVDVLEEGEMIRCVDRETLTKTTSLGPDYWQARLAGARGEQR